MQAGQTFLDFVIGITEKTLAQLRQTFRQLPEFTIFYHGFYVKLVSFILFPYFKYLEYAIFLFSNFIPNSSNQFLEYRIITTICSIDTMSNKGIIFPILD